MLILVIFLLFTIFRLCMRTCWWSYHLPVSSLVNFSVNTALMLISIILSRLIPRCTGTMTLFYHFSAFVLASLRLMFASLYFFLATDINTISNVAVHENGEKGYVRRFHLLKAMRCRELEGYPTWHCFYVHYNVCLFFLFVSFYFLTCLGTCCSSKTIQETLKICRSTSQWWIMN